MTRKKRPSGKTWAEVMEDFKSFNYGAESCQVKRRGWFHEHVIEKLCPYGYCRVDVCTDCGRIDTAMGPVGCPCDNTPGWRSHYLAGMGKPAVNALPRGRHASRVQRSNRRHRLPEWLKTGV